MKDKTPKVNPDKSEINPKHKNRDLIGIPDGSTGGLKDHYTPKPIPKPEPDPDK